MVGSKEQLLAAGFIEGKDFQVLSIEELEKQERQALVEECLKNLNKLKEIKD